MYTIVVNQPGYLPEVEPVTVETAVEAAEALEEEIQSTLFASEAESSGERYTDPAEIVNELRDIGHVAFTVGGYVHTASRLP